MLMKATSARLLHKAMKNLGKEVELKDSGEPTYILGIEVKHDKLRKTLTINQRKYVDEILKRFNMEGSKPVKAPIEVGRSASREETSENISDPNVPYQSLIRNLMYLVQGTRPDIAFAANFLSQFNSNYTQHHWRMAKRILRYLKGRRNAGITYTACKEPLVVFSDASWNEYNTGRSRSAYVYTLSKGAISWRLAKHQIVALSTCEAEYIALTEAMKEGKWLKHF
ncbi:uncharacterized protein LOC135373382 [Ornithodoros turicata]|uniref:uncharacterized protein LOC135373382 n=1 Tax=Ornithodoros turicata TaxID=34597 RepID=UPI00313930DA